MALALEYIKYLASTVADDETIAPKRGEEIFEGTDYPHDWDGFIGQEKAKEQLMVTAASAKARKARMEHTLIASGIAGVGKSTLATLLAFQAEVGLVRTTGPLTLEDARRLMMSMEDRDVLFIDEIHLLVNGNKNRADWLLPFMTEGKLYTKAGSERMPNITVVGATTDVGKLPETLISRFMIQPTIHPYSAEEGTLIAENLAGRMGVGGLDTGHLEIVAGASDNNPRVMRQILTQVRDLAYAYPDTFPNLDKALEWAGVSKDGLTLIAREILMLLRAATNNTQSIDSLRANLGEPGPIRHHEQQLLRRNLIEVTGQGRRLTDLGRRRASHELDIRARMDG
ncbi:Holliday junction branch migration DNA helicase RuvB [Nocardioides maradonensis]